MLVYLIFFILTNIFQMVISLMHLYMQQVNFLMVYLFDEP